MKTSVPVSNLKNEKTKYSIFNIQCNKLLLNSELLEKNIGFTERNFCNQLVLLLVNMWYFSEYVRILMGDTSSLI